VMGDPTPFILGATTTQPTACNSQCINVVLRYDPVDPGTLPGVTTSSLTSSTYTCALHVTPTGPPANSQYYIIVKGDFKLDSYTSVSYEKKIFRNIVAVPIITINTTPMTAEFYYIDDPAQAFLTPKPVFPYTFTMNPSTFPLTPGDPRFKINYDVYEINSNARPPWIKSYD
jgi:hypothetical protein